MKNFICEKCGEFIKVSQYKTVCVPCYHKLIYKYSTKEQKVKQQEYVKKWVEKFKKEKPQEYKEKINKYSKKRQEEGYICPARLSTSFKDYIKRLKARTLKMKRCMPLGYGTTPERIHFSLSPESIDEKELAKMFIREVKKVSKFGTANKVANKLRVYNESE